MKEKLSKIINYYGPKKQLKYFQSEIFELNETIILANNHEALFELSEPLGKIIGCDFSYVENIKDEMADVLVMLLQFKEFYNIKDNEIKQIMNQKIERQLERIDNEIKQIT